MFRERYGHTSFDVDANVYEDRGNQPRNWTIAYHYVENKIRTEDKPEIIVRLNTSDYAAFDLRENAIKIFKNGSITEERVVYAIKRELDNL